MEVKFRGVGGEWIVGWREGGLAVGVGVGLEVGREVGMEVEVEVGREGVVVMLRAEAVAEDCAVREAKAVLVEEGVLEAGLA